MDHDYCFEVKSEFSEGSHYRTEYDMNINEIQTIKVEPNLPDDCQPPTFPETACVYTLKCESEDHDPSNATTLEQQNPLDITSTGPQVGTSETALGITFKQWLASSRANNDPLNDPLALRIDAPPLTIELARTSATEANKDPLDVSFSGQQGPLDITSLELPNTETAAGLPIVTSCFSIKEWPSECRTIAPTNEDPLDMTSAVHCIDTADTSIVNTCKGTLAILTRNEGLLDASDPQIENLDIELAKTSSALCNLLPVKAANIDPLEINSLAENHWLRTEDANSLLKKSHLSNASCLENVIYFSSSSTDASLSKDTTSGVSKYNDKIKILKIKKGSNVSNSPWFDGVTNSSSSKRIARPIKDASRILPPKVSNMNKSEKCYQSISSSLDEQTYSSASTTAVSSTKAASLTLSGVSKHIDKNVNQESFNNILPTLSEDRHQSDHESIGPNACTQRDDVALENDVVKGVNLDDFYFDAYQLQKSYVVLKRIPQEISHLGNLNSPLLNDQTLRKHIKVKHSGPLSSKISNSMISSLVQDMWTLQMESDDSFKCTLCSNTSQHEFYQKICIRNIYINCKSFKCCECEQLLHSPHSLKSHMKYLHDENVFTCKICHKTYGDRSAYHKHELIHLLNNYECTICKARLSSRNGLHRHLSIHKRTPKTASKSKPPADSVTKAKLKISYKCNVCNMKCKTSSSLHDHQLSHTSKNKECPICKATLSSKGSLYRHIRTHKIRNLDTSTPAVNDEPLNDVYKCTNCDSAFSTQFDLENHKLSHASKIYECSICKAQYSSRISCSLHRRTHKRKRQPESKVCSVKSTPPPPSGHKLAHLVGKNCGDCGKVMKNISYVSAHKQLHAIQKDRHECTICQECFPTKQYLIEHKLLESHLGYQCDICKKVVGLRKNLITHIQAHAGNKNYCRICQLLFVSKYQFSDHDKKLHLATFKCELCKYASTSRQGLLSHVKNVHFF